MLAHWPQLFAPEMISAIMGEASRSRDRTLYGLMNAVTAAAHKARPAAALGHGRAGRGTGGRPDAVATAAIRAGQTPSRRDAGVANPGERWA